MLIYSIRDGFLRYWLKANIDGIMGLRLVLKDRKVLSKDTMKRIKEINKNRGALFYFLKVRLFKKNVRME